MTEYPQIVHLYRDDDTKFVTATVRISVPEKYGWYQSNGLPGVLTFEVYECGTWETDDVNTPLYEKPDWVSSVGFDDYTPDLDLAQPFAEGDVKWDGCVNWKTNCADCMHHHCDTEGISRILGAIIFAYQLALTGVGGGLA